MPKSWARPFNRILKSHCEAWRDAKGGAERKVITEVVEKAIRDQVAQADGEDGIPSDIEKASIPHKL